MNKVHKTIWSEVQGQWVAVSELSKGHQKAKSVKKMAAIAAFAMSSTLMGAVSTAQTLMTGDLVGPQISSTEITNVTNANILSTADSYAVYVAPALNATVNIKDSTVDSTHLSSRSISYYVLGAGDVKINLEGTNTIIQSDPLHAGTALVGMVRTGASGNVSVNVEGILNLYNKADTGSTTNELDGLELNARDGNVVFTHKGQGTIETVSGNAVYAQVLSGQGNVDVTLKGSGGKDSIIINTQGAAASSVIGGAHGISAAIRDVANTTSSITVATDAKITTTGDFANAIRAESKGGAVNITNAGSIATSGKEASAIYAVNPGSTAVNITNSGVIHVSGDSSAGIFASGGMGDIVVRHELGGKIISTGDAAIATDRADAIDIRKSTNQTGNLFVIVDGDIETHGANRAAGAYAQSEGGKGNVTVVGTGNVTAHATNQAAGINLYSYGLAATIGGSGSEGNATVSYSKGTITTGGDSAFALYAAVTGGTTGDAVVENFGGTLITMGDDSSAIWSRNATPNGELAKVHNDGKIFTSGLNSHGIYASGGRNIIINNNGTVATSGDIGRGIFASTSANSAGNISITNTGSITTSGLQSHAILALTAVNPAGSGKITINNSGNITTSNGNATSGGGAHAIYANETNTGANSDGIEVNQTGGMLTTTGHDSHGMLILSTAISGDLNVNMSNTFIDVKSRNSDGIDVQRLTSGDTNQVSHVDINITTNGGEIRVLQNPTSTGGSNFGIVAYQYDAAAGNINITNNGTKVSTGLGLDGLAPLSDAVSAAFKDLTATGNISIFNSGELSTQGANAKGISAIHAGRGKIGVINSGSITTSGNNSHGIFANLVTAGNIGIVNSGAITTTGLDARGVYAFVPATATSADIEVLNTGNITSSSSGIFVSSGVASGNSKVYVDGSRIETLGAGVTISAAESLVHLEVKDSQVIVHGKSNGIAAGRGLNATTVNTSTVKVFNSTIDGRDSYGADALMASSGIIGETFIYLDAKTKIYGGWKNGTDIGTGIGFNGEKRVLINEGSIEALSDWAIRGSRFTAIGAQSTINNYGTITGYMSGDDGDSVFNNYSSNSWNLRNFADTDGDGVRDTKAIAISDFGLGTDTIVNAATGTLYLAPVTGDTNAPDTTNEYLPLGALSTNTAGIVQGQLVNLQTFDNAGTIDLTQNGLAGDVFVITGGAVGTAGTYGGNQYISNGGSIKLNSVMNRGDTDSLSDIIVLDDVVMGSGATKIFVTPQVAGSTGALTEGDGIKLIEVLGSQPGENFALGAPVTYGLYEYTLHQGGAGGANNWYLRNKGFISPNAGGYLTNQYAAGIMFNQNILDRRNSIRNENDTIWGRFNISSLDVDMMDGKQEARLKTTLLQLGADLYKKDNTQLGVYAGYGIAQMDNKSKQSGSQVTGQVTGYQIGAYASWLPQDGKGLYADAWGYYAKYNNRLAGAAQQHQTIKYDGSGYAFSGEVGYAIELGNKAMDRNWMLEPHLQLIYANIDADDFSDVSNTRYSNNTSQGLQSRLGVRLMGEHPQKQEGISPFVEINWLHNGMSNKVNMNHVEVDSRAGKDVGEIKLGLHGQVNEKISVWAHLGGQSGSGGYKRYEGQFGLGWKW